MKLLTCAGYYATGSSAITDLLSECDNVHSCGDFEFRFVHDPDGICDLEYNLVLNNNRQNSGYAIKRYLRTVNFWNGNVFMRRYSNYWGQAWKEITEKYIDSLVPVRYKGFWYRDIIDRGEVIYFLERLYNKLINEKLCKNSSKNRTLFFKNEFTFLSSPGDSFYKKTRDYIDELFTYLNDDSKEFLFADQLVPVTNTEHYLQFFSNLKVVCVDRDPRDVFLMERYNEHGFIVPKDVETFCTWYRITREHKSYEKDNDNILRINFEDLIYNYDNTVDKVLSFCGIDKAHHLMKKQYFDPGISIKNTKLWEKYPITDEMKHISDELHEFFYNY